MGYGITRVWLIKTPSEIECKNRFPRILLNFGCTFLNFGCNFEIFNWWVRLLEPLYVLEWKFHLSTWMGCYTQFLCVCKKKISKSWTCYGVIHIAHSFPPSGWSLSKDFIYIMTNLRLSFKVDRFLNYLKFIHI